MIPLKDFKWRIAFFFFILGYLVLMASSHAYGAPHILIVTPPESGQRSDQQVVEISSAGRKKIAELSSSLMFGVGPSNVVIVALDNSTNKTRILVIDRQTSAIIAERYLTSVTPVRRMLPCENLVAVQAENSTAYFPISDGYNHFAGFAGANFATGEVHPFPNLQMSDFFDFVALPSGFAVLDYDMKFRVFDTTAQKWTLTIQDQATNGISENRSLYYSPGLGLMEYCKGVHYQLTNPDCSTVFANQRQTTSSDVNSKIFARIINGKPCLIWGEDKSDYPSQQGSISEIVIFDLKSKAELRMPLGATASAVFQPNGTGSRIYFLDLKNRQIDFLDTESQTVKLFSDLPIHLPAASVILDAY